jgi:hypothetical protein
MGQKCLKNAILTLDKILKPLEKNSQTRLPVIWRNIEQEHEGRINNIGKFIPAWFFHTKVIDVIYHKIFEPYGYILNWLETYLTAISIFILITFIKGVV